MCGLEEILVAVGVVGERIPVAGAVGDAGIFVAVGAMRAVTGNSFAVVREGVGKGSVD